LRWLDSLEVTSSSIEDLLNSPEDLLIITLLLVSPVSVSDSCSHITANWVHYLSLIQINRSENISGSRVSTEHFVILNSKSSNVFKLLVGQEHINEPFKLRPHPIAIIISHVESSSEGLPVFSQSK
jgi:hypothetical protein